MIDKELLERKIKYLSQEAWRIDQNTTVNSMIEYIVRESLKLLYDDVVEEFDELKYQISKLQEREEDGKDGRAKDAEGCQTATDEVTNERPKRGRKVT